MVKYQTASTGAGQWRMSPLRDLSTTGIRFVAEGAFPVGTALELQVCLPAAAQAISVSGRVVWARSAGAGGMTEHGVSFESLNAATQQQIAQVVEFFLRKA